MELNKMSDPQSSPPRKRLRYTRPCDECSRRKIKCDLSAVPFKSICTNCHEFGRRCTDLRKRLKSGPKPSKNLKLGTVQCLGNIPLKKILPSLESYQSWFYLFWPVLNSDELILKLTAATDESSGKVVLDGNDIAMTYAMCCALSSAISRNFTRSDCAAYLSCKETLLDFEIYAKEARRIVFMFELDLNPSTDLLLYNVFLQGSYGSVDKFANRSIMCLREAISISHILGMHCTDTYIGKSKEETHLWRKIYYMIFVIERFQCFRFQCYQVNISVLLDPSIPLPNLEDEKYPDLLLGFNELVQVFISADKQFLDTANRNISIHHKDDLDDFIDPFWVKLDKMIVGFNNSDSGTNTSNTLVSKDSLIKFQSRLSKDQVMFEKVADDSQRLNILLTKAWLQTLGWSLASENHLLDPYKYTSIDSLSITFPLEVATEFLSSTNKFPEIAFVRNGPGICMKMLQIVDALHGFVVISDQTSSNSLSSLEQRLDYEWSLANDRLFSLIEKIDRFRCFDYKIPTKVLMNIKSIQDSRPLSNNLMLSSIRPFESTIYHGNLEYQSSEDQSLDLQSLLES